MSSLEWIEAPHTSYTKPAVVTMYWELWDKGTDRTAWYNLPAASVRKVKDRQWELSMPDDLQYGVRYYKTLKEAKAMGIALVRMDDAV
jgi:hypothetical protein